MSAHVRREIIDSALDPAPDPLTAMLRAAVRPELLGLIAEIKALRTEVAKLATAPERPAYVPIKEAARQLGRHPRTIRDDIKLRRLTASKLHPGGSARVLVSQESIDRMLEAGRK